MRLIKVIYILVVSVVIAGMGEAYVRYDLRWKYQQEEVRVQIRNQALGYSPIDQLLGREAPSKANGLFRANTRFRWISTFSNDLTRFIEFESKTNNFGFFSNNDYSYDDDLNNEDYRIVFVGDSFTGIEQIKCQWVDQVQDRLRADPRIRKALGNRTVRTFNLGQPGAGLPEFWEAFEKYGKRFRPDLIVVNYIEADLPRTKGPDLEDDDAIIEQAVGLLSRFQQTGVPVLPLLMPQAGWEMVFRNEEYRLSSLLQGRLPNLKLVDVRKYLPQGFSLEDTEPLYFSPYDDHPSEHGAALYSIAVQRALGCELGWYDAEDMYCSNTLENGDFSRFPDSNSVGVSAKDGLIERDGWTFNAGAPGGPGRSEIKRLTMQSSRQMTAQHFLRWSQLDPSTMEAPPSMEQKLHDFSRFAGRKAALSFFTRADAEVRVALRVWGKQDDSSPEHAVFEKVFTLDPRMNPGWAPQRHSLEFGRVPTDDTKAIPAGKGYVRIEIAFEAFPKDESASIDLAEFFLGGEFGFAGTKDARLRPEKLFTQSCEDKQINSAAQPTRDSPYDRLTKTPEYLSTLMERIGSRYLETKLGPNLVSYALLRLSGDIRGSGLAVWPTGAKLEGGLVPVSFGPKDDDVAYLNLVCLKPPISLENPHCFHQFNLFVMD